MPLPVTVRDQTERSKYELVLPIRFGGFRLQQKGWAEHLASSMRTVLMNPPEGAYQFTAALRFREHILGSSLGLSPPANRLHFRHNPDRYKRAETLIRWGAENFHRRGKGERTLLWLFLELHLRGEEAEFVDKLGAHLRGCMDGKDGGRLGAAIGHCDGLQALLNCMAFREQFAAKANEEVRQTALMGLKSFDELWSKFLRAKSEGIIDAAGPDVDDIDAGEESAPTLSLSDAIPVLVSEGEEEDEPEECVTFPVDADLLFEAPPKRSELQAAAWGRELYRRSNTQLLRATENICPIQLVRHEWHGHVTGARHALDVGDTRRAESHLLALLSIEAGVSDAEARVLVWAHSSQGPCTVPRVDLRMRALLRPDLRPPHAFKPQPDSCLWHPACGFVAFPLSRDLFRIAVRLRLQRSKEARRASAESGSAVGWLLTQHEQRPVTAAFTTVGSFARMSAARYRMRIGAHIAAARGPDVAQIALGDTFGVGIAPCYYTAFDVRGFAALLGAYVEEVCGTRPQPRFAWLAAHAFAGSRSRPVDETLRAAWETFSVEGNRGRGRPAKRDFATGLRACRDALAIHLMFATGHRPVKALAELKLSNFAPQHALVVLGDKQVDPAHLTRLASTGWRFVGALEDYLNELRRVATSPDLRRYRVGAQEILEGRRSLFDAPADDGRWESLDVPELVSTLPAIWRQCRNLHRHLLCQWLDAHGVHHELRHFQLGWMVHEMHATSFACPHSPIRQVRELADWIDRWLMSSGWHGGSVPRGRQCVDRLPVFIDFEAEIQRHLTRSRSAKSQLDERLTDVANVLRPEVVQTLKLELQNLKAGLAVDIQDSRVSLVRKAAGEAYRPLRMGSAFIASVVAPVACRTERAHQWRTLVRILCVARRDGLIEGSLPKLPVPSPITSFSPFTPSLGIALRATETLRQALPRLLAQLSGSTGIEAARRLLAASVWAIAAYTPHRHLEDAYEIAKGAFKAVRSLREDNVLRVPWGEGHVVLSGVPALLASRLSSMPDIQDALRESREQRGVALSALLCEAFPDELQKLGRTTGIARMQTALLLAGEAELEGPARAIMRKHVAAATVGAVRAASAADLVTVETYAGTRASHGVVTEDDEPEIAGTSRVGERWHPRTHETLRLLNPSYAGRVEGVPVGPLRGRLPVLMRALQGALSNLQPASTLRGFLIAYAQFLLDPDGRGLGRRLAVGTTYKICNRISRALKRLSEEEQLARLAPEQWMAVLMPYCLDERAGDRREVLQDVRRFLGWLEDQIDLNPPDWGLLFSAAGAPLPPSDPALLIDSEVDRVLSVLKRDAEDESANLPLTERALRQTRLAFALVCEASGARPASVEGLTLADVHLHPDGDFIELRTRGKFASIKTRTSAGFVRLEGEHWRAYRGWFESWLSDLKSLAGLSDISAVPLLQVPRQPTGTRFAMDEVKRRIGDLIRWATGAEDARPYHLRKRRIQERHLALRRGQGVRTQHVAQVLRTCGHVSIATPVAAYLADPLAYLDEPRDMNSALSTRDAAALSGRSVGGIHQRWARMEEALGSQSELCVAGRLMALIHTAQPCWTEAKRPLPPGASSDPAELGWDIIAWALESVAAGHRDDGAPPFRLIGRPRWQEILTAADELALRLGRQIHFSSDGMRPPRRTPTWKRLEGLLKVRDARLVVVAKDWVLRALYRRFGAEILLVDAPAISALESLADELQLGLETACEGPLRSFTLVAPGGQSRYGLNSAMRWALAAAWVGDAIGATVSRASI